MNHPEVFIIPVMMLADYFLTVWGAILSEKKYRLHFKIEHYELNPLWQKNIASKNWFNPRHLTIVAIFTVFCFVWSNIWIEDDPVFKGFFGYLIVLEGSIIGNHLTNICIFFYVNRHPESIHGEIKMNHPLMLCMAQFRAFSLLMVLILIAIFSPTPFILGGLCSQICFLLVKLFWIAKANANEKRKPRVSPPASQKATGNAE